MSQPWDDAQRWESSWWDRETSSCTNTFAEESKHDLFIVQMGIEQDSFGRIDLGGKSVIDIGGGPVSILLRAHNGGRRKVVDPLANEWPRWVHERYEAAGIEVGSSRGEELSDEGFDEAWVYNVLQHVDDPKEVLKRALSSAETLRIFEWVKTGLYEGHIHDLSSEFLEGCIGQTGREITVWWNQDLVSHAFVGEFSSCRKDAFETISPISRLIGEKILESSQMRQRLNRPENPQVEICQRFEDEYWGELASWLIELRNTNGPQVHTWLDVGAGWGAGMELAIGLGITPLGIDCFPQPSVRHEIIECDILDTERLGELDLGRRDIIVCTETLEHLDFNPVASLRKIVEMTTPSYLFISVPDQRHAQWWPMGKMHYRSMPIWSPEEAARVKAHPYDHRKPWEMDEVHDLMSEIGFEVIGSKTTGDRNIVLGIRRSDGIE